MTEPVTADNITRQFLYGSNDTPALFTQRLRNITYGASGSSIDIDTESYMNTYGKYAVPARAAFVKDFFTGPITLSPGTYTVASLKSIYGDTPFRFSFLQATVDIGNNNYMDRAYIFGHVGFSLSDSTEFVVSSTGNLSMNNVSIIPENDNFDFVSTGASQILNENYLQPTIDPSEIGRQVLMNYVGTSPVFSYSGSDYTADVGRIASWDGTEAAAVAVIGANIIPYVEAMRANGVFETSRNGRKIVYDGTQSNNLTSDSTTGALFIGGSGDDLIHGTASNDLAYGGADNDTFLVSGGNDDFWGGDESGQPSYNDMDTVDYSASVKRIALKFDGDASSLKVETGLGTNTLHSIEKVVGTNLRDNFAFVGDIAADTNLTINAGGGAKDDIINFSASGPLSLDIGAGTLTSKITNGVIHLENFHTQIIGSSFDDDISDSSSDAKRIDGGAGDDNISSLNAISNVTIYGGQGQDILHGGSGNDVIIEEISFNSVPDQNGNTLVSNKMYGGGGSDYIESHSFLDEIDGGDGDDYIRTSFQTWGFPTLGQKITGGAGNDYVQTSGLVTVEYHYSYGDGNDSIVGDGWNQLYGGGVPTRFDLVLEDIDPQDISIIWDVQGSGSPNSYSGWGDMAIILPGGGSIFVNDVYGSARSSAYNQNHFSFIINGESISPDLMAQIDVQFGDITGYATDLAGFRAAVSLDPASFVGTSGDDEITGDLGDNTLVGGDGNDSFETGGGSDTIDGGNGVDTLILFGARANFSVSSNGSTVSITDQLSREGSVVLTSIENVFFITDNQTYSMGDFFGYRGTSGDDTLDASDLDNTLFGYDGDDTLYGRGGNDIFTGGAGNDVIFGGEGFDIAQFAGSSTDYIVVRHSDGSVTVTSDDSAAEQDVLFDVEMITFEGDSISIDPYSLPLTGGDGNDVILGDWRDDTIFGGAGDDSISGNAGFNVIDGGDGNDTVNYVEKSTDYAIAYQPDGTITARGFVNGIYQSDTLTSVEAFHFQGDNVTLGLVDLPPMGTSGDDTITGSPRPDELYGLNGNDILIGGDGADSLIGGLGSDQMTGGLGDDYYEVDRSDDTVVETTNQGYDFVGAYVDYTLPANVEGLALYDYASVGIGNALDNEIYGSENDDSLYGLDGDDYIEGYGGDDIIDGGDGADIVAYWGSRENYQVYRQMDGSVIVADLQGNDGSDTLVNVENIYFGSDDVTLVPADLPLGGTNGNDTLTGGNGDDSIYGFEGNDTLTGGAGNDALDGGDGYDVAVYAGNRSGYTISTGFGIVQINDNAPAMNGDDGTDTLQEIETAQFADTSASLASPIILDLNGNGVTLVDNKQTKVGFDWDGDGTKNQTGWIGKDDGFLFIDRDGNGTVTDAGELSFTSDKDGAKSDLDGLRAFDSNGDGIFSSADDQFGQFKVWRDKNGNGRVDKKEILSLQKAGVASIDLAGEAVNQSWEWGENITVNTGSFTRTNGTIGSFSDVALSYDTASSQNAAISKAASQLSEAIASFGDGWGTAAFGKFEALAERRDNLFAVSRGEWR